MAHKYKPVDLAKLKTYPIGKRAHKFNIEGLAGLPAKGATFAQWAESLPAYLGAQSLQALVEAIVAARRDGRPVVMALGAHVVKVGCSPIVCDLIRRGIVTAVAMNGATAIHDVEVATLGQTSEEVADTIKDGRFGMVEETPAFFADALKAAGDVGLGEALGSHLMASKSPFVGHSILAAAHSQAVPVTVHVAIGTDTIHMHENVARSDLGARSMTDFRLICAVVADMAPPGAGKASGVWCNVGSSVLLPEVFLKAIAAARNLGANLDDIVTANLDMLRHYRPSENVIGRPVKKGRGHQITGHHEIMLPMLRQMLIERM